MARAKKSIVDLADQWNRIARLADELGHRDGKNAARGILDNTKYVQTYRDAAKKQTDRADKAWKIATRYVANIAKTARSGQIREKGRATNDAAERDAQREKYANRKVARSTYMGRSNG